MHRSGLRICLSASLAVLALLSSSAGQDTTNTEALTKRVEDFFDNLNNETVSTDAAFNELLVYGPLADAQGERLSQTIEEYEKLRERYGDYLEAEQVSVKQVGNDLLILTFLYKTERFPVVWRFAYYRPPTEDADQDWFVVRLSFDTKLEKLTAAP